MNVRKQHSQIFKANFKKTFTLADFQEFKRKYPLLFETILSSMKDASTGEKCIIQELVDVLKTAIASLNTYGSHPIIEKDAEAVLRKATKTLNDN